MIMKKKIIKIRRIFIIYILIFTIIYLLSIYYNNHLELNITDSYPLGIYKIVNTKSYKKGDLVVFCPPYNEFLQYAAQQGYFNKLQLYCDNNTPKYIKKIVAVKGDRVLVLNSGVYINKIRIDNSEIFKKISSDEIFNEYNKEYIIKDNEFFVLSDYNKLSYDSRYFGIINEKNILYKVEPYIIYK